MVPSGVVPTVGIIPSDDDRRVLPLLRLHEGVDDVHDKDLFVDRIRIGGMAVLVSSIKGEVKKKHTSFGWNFSCFSAHLIKRDLF